MESNNLTRQGIRNLDSKPRNGKRPEPALLSGSCPHPDDWRKVNGDGSETCGRCGKWMG